MGIFSTLGKVVVYPFVRPVKDIKSSTRNMAEALKGAREARDKRREEMQAEMDQTAGMSPAQKFEEAYQLREWTEPELRQQLVAVRRSRYGMLALAAVSLFALLAFMWLGLHWLLLALIGPVDVVLLAGCVALAAKYAWFEYNLETRTMISFKSFLSREDLFRRVLWSSPGTPKARDPALDSPDKRR